MGCVFCRLAEEGRGEFLDENEHGYVIASLTREDGSHLLVVPRLHVQSLQGMVRGAPAIMRLLDSACRMVKRRTRVSSVSVWLGDGHDAGQRAPHLCWQVVARPPGDPASGAGMLTLLQLVNGQD